MKQKIAVIAGGNSSEYAVSIGSGKHVAESLDRTRYEVFLVLVQGHRWFHIDAQETEWEIDKNDFSVTIRGIKNQLDYALLMIHGTPGEDGLMQAYFDMMQIPYSSCGFVSSVITFNKSVCKSVLRDTEIPMASEILLTRGDKVDPQAIIEKLGLPLFVKPDASGSSCGVTKVKSAEALQPALEAAFQESAQVLLESFIAGTEVGCGILVTGKRPYLFPITEIVSKREFFDYEAKYNGFSDEITPARIAPQTVELLNRYSLLLYKKLNCRGIVRADFIIREGIPYFIEVNTVPGMSLQSIIPQQAAHLGLSMTELFNLIIDDTKA